MQELTEFNLEKATTKILILKDQMAQNMLEIGKTLVEVRDNLEKESFENWIKNEVNFSRRTAYNFIKIATTFPDVQPLHNLGTRKLLALAGLEEEDRQEVMQENNVEEMTTRELEQVVKEKKELTKQLKEEQEYSDELQQAIRDKEQQINKLKADIENIQKPETQIVEKEVVKEVIPDKLIQEKQELEEELETLRKRAEKAEEIVKNIRLEDNLKKDETYNTAKLDTIIVSVNEFLKKNSRFTYLKEDLQNIPPKKKKFIEQSVNSMKEWVMLMEQALDNRQDIVGDIIYGEGEVINE